jgi:hypothetical protein
MTHQEAAKLSSILKAFSKGEQIQIQSNGIWRDFDEDMDDFTSDYEYRVKPKPRWLAVRKGSHFENNPDMIDGNDSDTLTSVDRNYWDVFIEEQT